MVPQDLQAWVLFLLCSLICPSVWPSLPVPGKGGNGNCPKAAEVSTIEGKGDPPVSLQTWNLVTLGDMMYMKVLCQIKCYPSVNNYMVN